MNLISKSINYRKMNEYVNCLYGFKNTATAVSAY